MSNLTVPPGNIPLDIWFTELRQAAKQDLPTARQIALLRLIWQEAYLTRAGLIARSKAIRAARRHCWNAL